MTSGGCVDFTELHRVCPKNCYPLPKINQPVDSTSRNALLSFMGVFSSYHQISLLEANKKKLFHHELQSLQL